ncbi:N-formylglutamate amidohydrolase [Methanospirillum lacunae]|uniref:N-formylglutamate amidohydrolase n=1 Tax=Methanospirillum lacunae TaxID=668570 RepID=A0A2V2MYN9_9EURY|nr:N-formylglutamate amidohydrolase [Methanospirillum lacunae]PWR72579.1 N-formylglutamate amidohydrolase [Methanospirillum lacunae]
MSTNLPLLISVPHGGTEIVESVRSRLLLTEDDLAFYSDPLTRTIFGFQNRVAAYIDTPVSRMIVDLNRPPLPVPLHDPDGVIKTKTFDNRDIYKSGEVPDMHLIHTMVLSHYFPYHQKIDEYLDELPVKIAFDCHSMVPVGSENQKDAGKCRPLICLGNNGDSHGREREGTLVTCSQEWIRMLAECFRKEFPSENAVSLNKPFSGGFISNAHFWRKSIPWIQIEINRTLYEPDTATPGLETIEQRAIRLRERIWNVLKNFYECIRV